jgi:N-methylhydantoinase B
VYRGDRVTVQPAGSGGYGDPATRERARVEADIADGYISEAAARRFYGHGETVSHEEAALAVTAE